MQRIYTLVLSLVFLKAILSCSSAVVCFLLHFVRQSSFSTVFGLCLFGLACVCVSLCLPCAYRLCADNNAVEHATEKPAFWLIATDFCCSSRRFFGGFESYSQRCGNNYLHRPSCGRVGKAIFLEQRHGPRP